MRIKLVESAFVVAIAIMAGINVFKAQKPAQLSDVAMANVEALADNETDETGTLYGNAAGTRFCCKPGGTRTCAAATCPF